MRTFTVIIVGFFCLLFWQIGEDRINLERKSTNITQLEAFIPTPRTIIKTTLRDRNILFTELSYTLLRGIAGLFIGSITALGIVVLFLFFPKIRSISLPFLLAVNSFPIVGFSPLIILFFGQGSWIGIVFISALISYFPVLITLDKAISQIDKNLLDLVKIWGGNKWQTFIKIQLPIALPYFFASMRLSLPASIIGATLGEWLGTKHGIGQIITIGFYQLKPDLVYSSLFLLVFVIMILSLGMNLLEKYIIRFHS